MVAAKAQKPMKDSARRSTRKPVKPDGEFEKMLCFTDAAKKLNVTRQTIANYVNGGWIPFCWGVNGIPHIYEADLVEAIELSQRLFSGRGKESRFKNV